MIGNSIKKSKRRNCFNKKGFTLVEMVIVLAIFVTAILIITDIFMTSTRAQRKVAIVQKVQSDARYAMEKITEEIRLGTIDYSYYGGEIQTNPQETLALLDADNEQIIFKKQNKGVEMSVDGGSSWGDLTGKGVKVENLQFYISPEQDPFAEGSTVDSQPRVTIVLIVKSDSPKLEEKSPIFLQTTASSRVYRR